MKIASLVTTLAIFVSTTNATECTPSQIAEVEQGPEYLALNASCGMTVGLSDSSSSLTDLKKFCGSQTCVDAAVTLLKNFPDCEVGGINYANSVEEFKLGCQLISRSNPQLSDPTVTQPTATTPPTLRSSAAPSHAAGISATIVAVATAVYTYTSA